uniref:SecY-independent transporter protein n=1 Tax=Rhexinema sarcinoideum TaxID=43261 RepID=A0A1B2RYW5_9CHLO|nr:SecY-independent transporter protein [Rhexinema sarcinoideum]
MYKMEVQKNKNNSHFLDNSAIFSIFEEIKLRAFYLALLIIFLLGLVYLNYGLIIEFQGSYYSNYYQFIDFNWCEGVKEINESLTLKTKPNSSEVDPSENNFKFFKFKKFINSFLWPKKEAVNQLESYQECKAHKNIFLKQNLTLAASPDKAKTIAFVKNSSFSSIEIDEYKPFFISTLSYFSGQIKFIYNVAVNFENSIFEKPKDKILYFMFIFYQLAVITAYHGFCLVGSAMTQHFRLKLLKSLTFFYLLLALHFLTTPMVMVVCFELQIENLDSELFYGNSFDFLKLWVKSFYGLHTAFVLLLLFLYFVAVVIF